MNDPAAAGRSTRDVTAGLILILAALLSLVAVAHHPVIKAGETGELFQQIQETALTDRLVHGALIVCGIAVLFSLCRLAQRLGIDRNSVLLGLIFYSLGTATLIGAALIDGFFVPEIGARYYHGAPAAADGGLALLRFCSIAIQIFTKLSIIVTSIAILLWSISFARTGRGPLIAAVVGVAAALSQGAILFYNLSAITAHTVIFVLAAQMIWYLIVGWLLIKGEL